MQHLLVALVACLGLTLIACPGEEPEPTLDSDSGSGQDAGRADSRQAPDAHSSADAADAAVLPDAAPVPDAMSQDSAAADVSSSGPDASAPDAIVEDAVEFVIEAAPTEATLAGQVLDLSTGAPLPDALVTLDDVPLVLDATASFSTLVAVGEAELSVSQSGYLPFRQLLAMVPDMRALSIKLPGEAAPQAVSSQASTLFAGNSQIDMPTGTFTDGAQMIATWLEGEGLDAVDGARIFLDDQLNAVAVLGVLELDATEAPAQTLELGVLVPSGYAGSDLRLYASLNPDGSWAEMAQPTRVEAGMAYFEVSHFSPKAVAVDVGLGSQAVLMVHGNVTYTSGGMVYPVHVGDVLPPGVELSTGDGQAIKLENTNGGQVTLGPNSTLNFKGCNVQTGPNLGSKFINWLRGKLIHHTRWHPPGPGERETLYNAPNLSIGVRGTQFETTVDDTGTRVRVLGGSVDVTTANGTIMLEAGEQASRGPGGEELPSPLALCDGHCNAARTAVLDPVDDLIEQCLPDETCVDGEGGQDASCECANPSCVIGETVSCEDGMLCVCQRMPGFGCGDVACNPNEVCGDICPYISCNDPGPGHCYHPTTLIRPIAPGTCENSRCSYASETISCPSALTNGKCEDGECVDACAGVQCPAPRSHCWSNTTLIEYQDGTCEGWEAECTFSPEYVSCAQEIANGTCDSIQDACVDACVGVVCTALAPQCDGFIRYVYVNPRCEGSLGRCTQDRIIESCPDGCTGGICN